MSIMYLISYTQGRRKGDLIYQRKKKIKEGEKATINLVIHNTIGILLKDGLLRERKKARFGFALRSEGIWVSRGKRREKERKACIRVIRFLAITLK